MSFRRGIDEAFPVLAENIAAFTDLIGEIADEDAGVRMQLEEVTIETPIELDIDVAENGAVSIGSAPPLYSVDVSVMPVFHRLRLVAVAEPAVESSRSDRHGESELEPGVIRRFIGGGTG